MLVIFSRKDINVEDSQQTEDESGVGTHETLIQDSSFFAFVLVSFLVKTVHLFLLIARN